MPTTANQIADMLVNPHCTHEFINDQIDGEWRSKIEGETLSDCLRNLRQHYHRTYGDETGRTPEEAAIYLVADVMTRMEQVN